MGCLFSSSSAHHSSAFFNTCVSFEMKLHHLFTFHHSCCMPPWLFSASLPYNVGHNPNLYRNRQASVPALYPVQVLCNHWLAPRQEVNWSPNWVIWICVTSIDSINLSSLVLPWTAWEWSLDLAFLAPSLAACPSATHLATNASLPPLPRPLCSPQASTSTWKDQHNLTPLDPA